MAINFPFPYQIHYSVTSDSGIHRHSLGVNITSNPAIGANWGDIDGKDRFGATIPLINWMATFSTLLSQCLPNGAQVSAFELWKYAPQSNDGEFVSASPTEGATGSAGSSGVATYRILSFRTMEGGVAKITLFDRSSTAWGNGRGAFPSLDTGEKALVNHIISPASIAIGRDGGHLVAFHRHSSGQNEALWRKVYRA